MCGANNRANVFESVIGFHAFSQSKWIGELMDDVNMSLKYTCKTTL